MFQPDEKLEAGLQAWLSGNRQNFLEDIKTLVAIRSVSENGTKEHPFGDGCARVLDKALELADGYGFPGVNHEYYCGSCHLAGAGTDRKELGIFAHLDVVPEGEGWGTPPYSCTVKDGWLIGRGVGDNKGPAVCALYALRFLREAGISLKNDVFLYFGCSEETGMADIAYFNSIRKAPDFALVPDVKFPVCCGEKGILRFTATAPAQGNLRSFTAGEVVNVVPSLAEAVLEGVSIDEARTRLAAYEGLQLEQEDGALRITASGLSKHAAFPEGSVNAIHLLAKALDDTGLLTGSARDAIAGAAHFTTDYYGETTGIPLCDEQSGRLTCVGSVARLEEGTLSLRFDVRYPVTADGSAATEALTAYMGRYDFAVCELSDDKPSYVPMNHPAIPVLCDIAEHVLAKRLEPYTMGGGTYARKLPCAVGFGPGAPDDEQTPFPPGHGSGHQPDECIREELLLDGVKAYVFALLELDQLL